MRGFASKWVTSKRPAESDEERDSAGLRVEENKQERKVRYRYVWKKTAS